ncbi:MAG: DUF6249 domain-containing protein [Chthoniobacterales bacterium]
MKTSILTFFCAAFVSLSAVAQTPTSTVPPPPPTAPVIATPAVTPAFTPAAPAVLAVTATPFATATPAVIATPANSVTVTVSSSSTPSADDEIDNMIENKIKRHFNFTSDRHHSDSGEDSTWLAVPIVLIVFMAIFGMPVLIVAVILYFSFSKNRSMHKTVRMMVEKGQPVPEALLNPPPVVRQRSDLRRGVKWALVGLGVMIFFGATSGWDGGAWSLGIIPFMIGIGYLIFWRLDLRHEPVQTQPIPTSQPPPPPPPPSSPTV